MAEIHVRQIGGSALPHFLEVNPMGKSAYNCRGVFEDGLAEGDLLVPFHIDVNLIVGNVIEKRKPRGDWSGDAYKGKVPMYYEFEATKAERPKPQAANG
jgi:hypothetical protein